MTKKAYVGVNNVARNVSKLYVGVNGVAREVKKGYVGVNGVARLFYEKVSAHWELMATSIVPAISDSAMDFMIGGRGTGAPVYEHRQTGAYIYIFVTYDYSTQSFQSQQAHISAVNPIRSSSTYNGMSPLPTFAPSATGSKYYVCNTGTNEALKGTWCFVYDASAPLVSLYKWIEA